MPAPWALGAQGRIIGRIHGQQTVNVMHFATNLVATDINQINAALERIVTALIECARTTLLPAVSSDWTLVRTEAHGIHPTRSDPIVATANAGEIGALSPTSVSFASSLLHIRTGIGGRRGRGRIFLPPAGESEINQSAIDPATGLLLVQFAACLAAKFGGPNPETEWRLGVLSTTDLKAQGGNFDNSFRVASQLTPGTIVAVMRSRKVGVGS